MKSLNYKYDVEVVAEIGCNHQGKVDKALLMVEEAASAGANIVKFQKRSNKILFGPCIYDQVYDNSNSYGKTYGEHRENLEFDKNEFTQIKNCANINGVELQITPFDIESLSFCEEIGCESYKVASADIHYHQLIESICKTKKPIYISTGGCEELEIINALNIIDRASAQATLYHCTAAYPAPIEHMNLLYLKRLKELFGSFCTIGLSDHENGIDAASIAYMLGARTFEKHFTLDRSLKGTDQSFSLEPIGLQKMIRNLRRIEIMMGSGKKEIYDSEIKPLSKMVKSIVCSKNLSAGEILDEDCLDFKVVLIQGLKPSSSSLLIGKQLRKDKIKGETLSLQEDLV